jgi:hypothetical protein
MPTNRVTRRRIREILRLRLRLHLQAGLSYGEVRRALKVFKSVVDKYVLLARVASGFLMGVHVLLIGYARVTKSDGSETLAPQRDACLPGGSSLKPIQPFVDYREDAHEKRQRGCHDNAFQ